MLNAEMTGSKIYYMLREHFGTVEKAAEGISVSVQALYKWKKGRCIPSIDTLIVISDAVGCSIDEMIVRN